MKVAVVVPAFNNEHEIREVLEGLENLPLDLKVLVVDDGSTDNTRRIVEREGASMVRHYANLGQWAALRTGFVVAEMDEPDVIVTMDADLQHCPEDLLALLDPIMREDCDFVVGSRFLNRKPNMPLYRSVGIRFFNFLVKLVTGKKLTDCLSGYKAFTFEIARKLELNENQYGALEFLVKMVRQNARIREVPIKTSRASSSKGSLRYGYNLLRTILDEM